MTTRTPTKKRVRVTATYVGYEERIDLLIERAAGARSGGGGYCFQSGERDLSFSYKTKPQAVAAARKIRGIHGVRASIRKD